MRAFIGALMILLALVAPDANILGDARKPGEIAPFNSCDVLDCDGKLLKNDINKDRIGQKDDVRGNFEMYTKRQLGDESRMNVAVEVGGMTVQECDLPIGEPIICKGDYIDFNMPGFEVPTKQGILQNYYNIDTHQLPERRMRISMTLRDQSGLLIVRNLLRINDVKQYPSMVRGTDLCQEHECQGELLSLNFPIWANGGKVQEAHVKIKHDFEMAEDVAWYIEYYRGAKCDYAIKWHPDKEQEDVHYVLNLKMLQQRWMPLLPGESSFFFEGYFHIEPEPGMAMKMTLVRNDWKIVTSFFLSVHEDA